MEVVRATGQKTLRIIVHMQSASGEKIVTSTPIKNKPARDSSISSHKNDCDDNDDEREKHSSKIEARERASKGSMSISMYIATGGMGVLTVGLLTIVGFSFLRNSKK